MKASVQQMQGVSAYIETHYEALAYCKQEKKVCHYKEYWKCTNPKSVQCNKDCIGYTKCADFISDAKYNEKIAKASRNSVKKNQNKATPKSVKSKPVKSKPQQQHKVSKRVVEKKLPDNALGNDPRIRAVLEQFMNQ
jgi:hypothetical protein